MTGEAVGTFQGVRQRLRIGTSQERGLTTEPGTEKCLNDIAFLSHTSKPPNN